VRTLQLVISKVRSAHPTINTVRTLQLGKVRSAHPTIR